MRDMDDEAGKSPLCLYARDRESRLDDVLDALESLSYDVRVQYVDGGIEASQALNSHANAAYFGEKAWPKQILDGPGSGFCDLDVSVVIAESGALDWAGDHLRNSPDFVIWPCMRDELAIRLKRAAPKYGAELSESDKRLRAEFAALGLIGRAPAFLSALRLIKGFAACDAPVLIYGETGTGKELLAKAIHHMSRRAKGPFVPINCGALPEGLVENELFGHESGAFTDAKKAQPGLLSQAAGGTVFLDEIEAMCPKAQVVLLRFLEDFRYRPLGGFQAAQSEVKVVAATNADLKELARSGDFRSDLLYRLDVLSLLVPPLRDRREDIELLATHFIGQLSARYDQQAKRLHPAAREWLVRYSWPGNVRELENLIHRSFVTSPGSDLDLFTPGSLSEAPPDPSLMQNGHTVDRVEPFQDAKAQFVAKFERDYLLDLMKKAGGNVTRAARMAGKERRALGKLLQKHSIPTRQFGGR